MIKKIHLIHHTHFDIGYTDLPEEVISQQMRHLDQAVALGKANPSFHWTLESSSLLEFYLKRRSPAMGQSLLSLLQSGQFECGAFYMQMLTDTASAPELVQNVSKSTEMAKKYGFQVNTAILDDIGGWSRYVPNILSEYGVRYFIAGVGACQAYLPWADLPHLFYHKTPDGSKTLVWNLGIDRILLPEKAHNLAIYGMGISYLIFPYLRAPEGIDPLDNVERCLKMLFDRLEREHYPYEELLLQVGMDNYGPCPQITQVVEALNASGRFPAIELGTSASFFENMEAKYGKNIPEVEGVVTDPWIIRLLHAPSTCKAHRQAQRLYQEILLQGGEDNGILRDLQMTADHTVGNSNWKWQYRYRANNGKGSGEGLSASVFDRLRKSWETKASYPINSRRQAGYLLEELHGQKFLPGEPVFAVHNASPHPVSGYVTCYANRDTAQFASITDENGQEIPFVKLASSTYLFHAQDVPPLGTRNYTPHVGKLPVPDFKPVSVPEVIETDALRLCFSQGRLTAIHDRAGHCFATAPEELHIGGVCGEELLNCPVQNELASMMEVTNRRRFKEEHFIARLVTDNELFCQVQGNSHVGSAAVESRITIWKHEPRLDFSVRLNKPESPWKETYYAAFPLSGRRDGLHYDQNIGTVTPTKELLPGSLFDVVFCSRYAAVEGDGFHSVLVCKDAPGLSFGGMNVGRWYRQLPEGYDNGHIYGLLYNNICNTDAWAWSPVLDSFEYSLFLNSGGYSATQAQHCAEEALSLSCAYEPPSPPPETMNVPKELRLHPVHADELWLENLANAPVDYDFTLQEHRYHGRLSPLAVVKA